MRSHSMAKLERVTGEIREVFATTVAAWTDPTGSAKGAPSVSVEGSAGFPGDAVEPEDR